MKTTSKVLRAVNVAAQKHLGQVRKADGLPYITHPFAVAMILTGYTDDEDVICGGLLHDVLEDVKNYRYEDLKNDFGERVAEIVKDVSEDKDPNVEFDEKATWEERKQKYLDHLKTDGPEAMMVCAADKIHNLLSMAEAHNIHGDSMWDKFNSPADKKTWFYEEVLKIVETKLSGEIVDDLRKALEEVKRVVKG